MGQKKLNIPNFTKKNCKNNQKKTGHRPSNVPTDRPTSGRMDRQTNTPSQGRFVATKQFHDGPFFDSQTENFYPILLKSGKIFNCFSFNLDDVLYRADVVM